MKFSRIFLALPLALLAAGCASLEHSRDLANPNVSGTTLAQQVCSACHGVDGHAVSPNFPNLAAQQPVYFMAQLKEFRGHNRLDPAGFEYMWGISQHLTDDQIKGLAAYFSQQLPKPNLAGDAQSMAAGKQIFEQGIAEKQTIACMVCHGPKAQGRATFPRLANQHRDYLVKQLHVFQETEGRPGTPMKQITHFLTDPEMQAVASYLQSMPVN
ncbi:cytochrome c-552 precursor [mine drainage metagenome]|uniref:Cytochrome c-552 n=1 Tax=mine drainage metagenome TaxID=410659 RepID=A0A1J5PVW2_9ZZZZ